MKNLYHSHAPSRKKGWKGGCSSLPKLDRSTYSGNFSGRPVVNSHYFSNLPALLDRKFIGPNDTIEPFL